MQILLSVRKSGFFILLYLMLDLFLSSFAQKCKVIYEWDFMSHVRYCISPPISAHTLTKDSCKTRNFIPYSSQIVCGFFNVPHCTYKHGRYFETGPTDYSPYSRRLESLTICRCNFNLSYFQTLSDGSAESQTHDLPFDSLMLNQLSHQGMVL